MKNILYTLLALSCASTIQSAYMPDLSTSQMQATLTGGHTQTYAVDSLFQEPLNYGPWVQAIDILKSFVLHQAKNIFGVQDKALLVGMQQINSASMRLVNSIKITYGSKKSIGLILNLVADFTALSQAMGMLIQDLENISYTLTNRKNAQYLLIIAAKLIQATANKGKNDLIKIYYMHYS